MPKHQVFIHKVKDLLPVFYCRYMENLGHFYILHYSANTNQIDVLMHCFCIIHYSEVSNKVDVFGFFLVFLHTISTK